MTAPHHGSRTFSPVLAVVLAFIAGAAMLYYHQGLFMPRVLEIRAAKGLGDGYAFGDDFYPIWLTAKLWPNGHRDLYGAEMTRAIQTGLFGRPLDARNRSDPPADYRTFAYPAFTELLFWPTAILPFPALRIVLVILLPLITVCSIWLWLLALEWNIHWLWFLTIALLTLCNYPVLEALFALQPGLIVGFLLAASLFALRKDRPLLAGILIALTTIKPQITALAILYLLLWLPPGPRRRAHFMAGFFATLLTLVAASLLIWPSWIPAWSNVILGYHRYATPPLVSELLGPTLGALVGPLLIAALLVVSAALAWRKRRASLTSPDFWLTLSLLLAVTSVAILPGQAIYDQVILLPGILVLLRDWPVLRQAGRVPRILQKLGVVVFLWPWAAVLGLILVRPLLPPERFASTAVFALPIRTAGSFPFAVLALLLCAMRSNLVKSRAPS